jgi:hypothetical protein
MKGITSLIVTGVIGYMLWTFFAPLIQSHVPNLGISASGAMNHLKGLAGQFKGMI